MSSTIESRVRPLPIVTWLDARTVRQRRLGLAVAIGAVSVLLVRALARVLLDRWWYESVTEAPVWSTRVTAQAQLGVAALVVSITVLGGTLWRVLRTEPVGHQPLGSAVRWYRAKTGPGHRWLLLLACVVIGWTAVTGAIGTWRAWVLFRNGETVGQSAPELGWDLGYYLFRLPFLEAASGWLRGLLLAATLVTVFGYLVSGALRLPIDHRRSSPTALRHLGVLGALLALAQAAHYVFGPRPRLAVDRSGSFDGPGFVQLNVLAPGLWVLAVAAVIAAIMSVVASRARALPAAVLVGGIWAALHVLVVWAVPAIVERVVVAPAEADRELAHIGHNLAATREVYALDTIATEQRTVADGITGPVDEQERRSVERVAVFGTRQLTSALQVLQGTTATRITDVDIDRYVVDGERRAVMVAARNANASDLPERGWVQRHLVYTHGDGVVLVPADTTADDGRPDADALVQLAPTDAALYFGEGLRGWYAIVGTDRREQGGVAFGADTGIPLGSTWRRLVTATAFGEVEPLVSSELTNQSQLLMRRELRERIHALAPFLAVDGDPYPVVSGGRVVWMVDAYTTSATYPYAQTASLEGVPATSDLRGRRFNYLRASVTVTVDGRDGRTHLYRTETADDDVVLHAWDRALPGLLEDITAMPADLQAHRRTARDLLQIQANLLGRYHVTDAELLFNGSERRIVSPPAGDGVGTSPTGPGLPVSTFLPTEGGGDEWTVARTYSPGAASNSASGREELAAILYASDDQPGRLRLVDLEPAGGRQLSSPRVAQSAIDADPDLARLFTLLNANGSKVEFGPMTPLLLGDGLVWFRSIVVSGTAQTTAPRVYGTVAVSNGLVSDAATPTGAVDSLGTEDD